MSNLQIRLKNCLQTILELEPEMETHQGTHFFSREFQTLKVFLERIDGMALMEDDVVRLESATADFLAEMRLGKERTEKRLLQ